MENWKSVKGYEGIYEVSNNSKIRTLDRRAFDGRKLKGIVMKQLISKDGYVRIKLYKNKKQKTYYLHRLIMEAFYGKSTLDVNHKDGVKSNNNLSNLEYLSRSENHKHAYKIGLKKVSNETKEKIKHNFKKTHKQNCIPLLDTLTNTHFKSKQAAAKELNVSMKTINKRIKSKQLLITKN